jgi:hypothetical protein
MSDAPKALPAGERQAPRASAGNVIVLLQRWNDGRVLAVRRDASCVHAPGML